MAKLVVLAGLPGSGKTTWARTFFNLKYNIASPDAVRISEFGSLEAAWSGAEEEVNDKQTRVFDIFHRSITDALEHGVDVVADATHLTRRARHNVRALAHGISKTTTHLVLFRNVLDAAGRNFERTGAACVPEPIWANMVDGYYNLIADLEDGERGLYDSVTMIESFA